MTRSKRMGKENEYEKMRDERMKQNLQKLQQLGVNKITSFFVQKKKANCIARQPVRKAKIRIEGRPNTRQKAKQIRRSPRLRGVKVEEYKQVELVVEESWETSGRMYLPNDVVAKKVDKKSIEKVRCGNINRGSMYDQKAGITCHFCRQKKLCGEPNCPRCSTRSVTKECIGKSECTRCGSATGRFCRACLLIRYGWELEDVRKHMQEGTWLCPHCYEEENPHKGWICNSSICMTRRGLAPTGIAIYEAQERGFPSVAHYVQAKLLKYKKGV